MSTVIDRVPRCTVRISSTIAKSLNGICATFSSSWVFWAAVRATWPDVWAVIKASAERRLGKPLLKAYFFLAVFGIVVVAVALLVTRI